ncbi:hypothetical protein CYMTET_55503 [Cymbomonas tetramitiformis]|uniref:Uncharacterized protein n=1 Tax=Cymbomonas tetramitiformis TaxID=36881 RepID=A0AAE0EPP3_9CHLO|nr:hypothetical protein CYMTET_55503 [Cymbomonas tetramitiformis]
MGCGASSSRQEPAEVVELRARLEQLETSQAGMVQEKSTESQNVAQEWQQVEAHSLANEELFLRQTQKNYGHASCSGRKGTEWQPPPTKPGTEGKPGKWTVHADS